MQLERRALRSGPRRQAVDIKRGLGQQLHAIIAELTALALRMQP